MWLDTLVTLQIAAVEFRFIAYTKQLREKKLKCFMIRFASNNLMRLISATLT